MMVQKSMLASPRTKCGRSSRHAPLAFRFVHQSVMLLDIRCCWLQVYLYYQLSKYYQNHKR